MRATAVVVELRWEGSTFVFQNNQPCSSREKRATAVVVELSLTLLCWAGLHSGVGAEGQCEEQRRCFIHPGGLGLLQPPAPED